MHRRQEEARDVGRGRHFEVLGHIAVRELVAEHIHPKGRASPVLLRLVAEALRRLLARVPNSVLGARHLRRVLLAHDLELLAEGGVALLLDEGNLGVLVDHLAHLCQLVAARLLQDVLGEHVLKAARHRRVGLNLLPDLAQVEVAELGVLARKGEEHEALKELVQLEPLVAALGALAFLDTRVALGRDESRVYLVGAHEDQVDPRHGEGIGRELAVERQVGQLRRLHRHRRLGRAGARRARFGILGEDGHELRKVLLDEREGLVLPNREAVDVRERHLVPGGDEALILLGLLPLERRCKLLVVEARRHRHACIVNDGLLVADHAPVVDHRHELVRVRHLLDLGVFDVPNEAEQHDELLKVDRLCPLVALGGVAAGEPVLARGERALDVEPREVHVLLGEDVALDLRMRLDEDVTRAAPLRQLILQHVHRHDLLPEDLANAHRGDIVPRASHLLGESLGILLVLQLPLHLGHHREDVCIRLEGRLDQSERVALRVHQDVLLEQRLKAAGERVRALVVPKLAQLRVRAEKGDGDDRLEELNERERLVARLRKLAPHHRGLNLLNAIGDEREALVFPLSERAHVLLAHLGILLDAHHLDRGRLHRVVDLVGADEDVLHAHRGELIGHDAAVHREVHKLGLLHRRERRH